MHGSLYGAMTLSITTLTIVADHCYAECHMPFMFIVVAPFTAISTVENSAQVLFRRMLIKEEDGSEAGLLNI
jgi:hypothetical protein